MQVKHWMDLAEPQEESLQSQPIASTACTPASVRQHDGLTSLQQVSGCQDQQDLSLLQLHTEQQA